MDADLGQFETNVRKQNEFDPVDVDLTSQILFQLLQEELLQVVVARQERRKEKKRHTGDQKDCKEDNENARSGHSNSLEESHAPLCHLTESLA